MSKSQDWASFFHYPIGRWRTSLLWRVFGIVLIQYVTIQAQDFDWATFMGLPRGLHLTGLAGLLLVIVGARLWALILATGVLLSYLLPIYFYVVTLQVSEEYLLFLCLPLMSIFLTFLIAFTSESNDRQALIDDTHCLLFRISAVVMMGFAAFHKLNSDFLNPDVSCAAGLFANMTEWWRIPLFAIFKATPLSMGIITEALVPFSLMINPALGLIYTIGLMAFIGLLGATAFTLIVIVMVLGFLRHEDGDVIKAGLVKWKWPLCAISLVLAIISFLTYTGKPHWMGFFLYQTTTVWLFAVALIPVLHKRSTFYFPNLFGQHKTVRMFLMIYLIAGLLNGMSPYLGWKFRSSYAMLSNLRVDQNRWNHLLVPQSFFLPQHDHFIRITKVDLNAAAFHRQQQMVMRLAKEGMVIGLVSPMSLALRMKRLNGEGIKVDLTLTYQGRDYFFPDATHNSEFKTWLSQLPHNKLFQEWLVSDGPQPCYH